MFADSVRTPSDALVYLTDCTLATVVDLAMKKRRPAGEYKRQIHIAQRSIDWMDQMGIDYSNTRAADAKKIGSVAAWARQYEPE